MDFALLPPEVNSGRMYTGPGAAPMLAAAAAFDAVAAELDSAAEGCAATLTELGGRGWAGPSAQAAMAAGTRYATWLRRTAAVVAESAMHARSAVTAYETAFAATVPPTVVSENRVRLAVLVATNFFGQNTPAIAATEAEYAGMWAQDAAAMYGYAAAASAARQLQSFDAPPPVANPIGSWAPGLSTMLDPAKTASWAGANGFSLTSSFYTVLSQGLSWSRQILVRGGVEGIVTFEGLGPRGVLSSSAAPIPGGAGGWPNGGGGFGRGPVGATMMTGMGHAGLVGRLSVPPAWTDAAPGLRPAAVSLTSTQVSAHTAAPAPAAEPAGFTFQQALMGTFAGQGRGDGIVPDGRRSAGKTQDSDGQRIAALTSSGAWLGSARAHHERLRDTAQDAVAPLRSHWWAGSADRPA